MYTLSFKKKHSSPQPSKNRKINVVSDATLIEQGEYTEVNPTEYFNNTQYPFIYIDGDKADYIFGKSSSIDHGYYILYDNNTTNNERRFYANVGFDGTPVDIRYSTEINSWILIDDASIQNFGILEANTLEGPWNIGGGYGGDPDYAPTPTPIPLSSIEAMFKNDTISNSFLCFINYNSEKKLYYFYFKTRNGARFNDYNGLSVHQDYCINVSPVDINTLTKETPLSFKLDTIEAGGYGTRNANTTITLLEE